MTVPSVASLKIASIESESLGKRQKFAFALYPFNTTLTVQANDNRSLGQRIDQLIDLFGGVVEVWGDPKAITSWRGDDVLRF